MQSTQTTKTADAILKDFLKDSHNLTPENIQEEKFKIRKVFRDEGYDLTKGSKADRDIDAAAESVHAKNQDNKETALKYAGAHGGSSASYIEEVYTEILKHREALGFADEELAVLNKDLNELRIRAHQKGIAATFKELETEPHTDDSIYDSVLKICRHDAALGSPVEVGTIRYNRIWDTAQHTCDISGLSDFVRGRLFDNIEKWIEYTNKKRERDLEIKDVLKAIERNWETPYPKDYESRPERSERHAKIIKSLYYRQDKRNKSADWLRVAQRNERLQARRKLQQQFPQANL